MERLRSIDELPRGLRFVAAVGVFDGVHRGHCHLLKAAGGAASRLSASTVAVTFDPHPEAVVRGRAPALLCDLDERIARLDRAGAELAVVQRFDRQLSELSAEAFVDRLGRGRELAGLVMTGESAFGHRRAGTAATLEEVAKRKGFDLVRVDPFRLAGAPVSSSRIRELIGEGRLGAAKPLLGRAYAVRGEVVHGDGRGRGLGYPTANLSFEQPVALPPDGIYAVLVSWGGPDPLRPTRREQGVASLGVRPTFGPGGRVLEVYLLDFDELIYGERLRVTFVRRQRGERRFRDAAALVRQMGADAKRAREVLARSARLVASEQPC
jgi:riboflavin kinase / FMN adenylyltransferase